MATSGDMKYKHFFFKYKIIYKCQGMIYDKEQNNKTFCIGIWKELFKESLREYSNFELQCR